MIRHNIGYKLMALMIAFVIWIYVNEFQSNNDVQSRKISYVSSSFIVPLKATNVGADVAVDKMPSQVMVVIEGRQEDVDAIAADQDQITARVNLRGYSIGSQTVPVIAILPEDIPGLRKRTEPRSVNVVIAEKVRRQMGIETQFIGLPPDAYRFTTPTTLPANANISGTAKSVKSVNRLVVQVNSSKLTKIGIDRVLPIVALDANDERIKGLEISPESAHVRLGDIAGESKRSLFVNPNTIGQPPLPYKVSSVEIEHQAVTAVGKPSDLVGVDMLQTEPIQLADRKQTFTERVRIVAPTGITLPEGDYANVTVKIVASHQSSAPDVQSTESKLGKL